MIQRLVTLLITLYISISLQAQDKKKPGFTKEEFRARQEAYLTQKAEITQEEATKFFPIYFELQDRKKTVNDKKRNKKVKKVGKPVQEPPRRFLTPEKTGWEPPRRFPKPDSL